jgi:hypothetical protein
MVARFVRRRGDIDVMAVRRSLGRWMTLRDMGALCRGRMLGVLAGSHEHTRGEKTCLLARNSSN